MEKKYNYIFSKLVENEHDLIGTIAYGIYKKHKVEFVQKIKDEEKREPTMEECKSFIAASTTESQLENYRNQASVIFADAAGDMIKEEVMRFERDMLRNYKKEITACLPSNWKSVWLGVISGVVSAFLFALIGVSFYLIGETTDKPTHNKTKKMIKEVVGDQDSTRTTRTYQVK